MKMNELIVGSFEGQSSGFGSESY